MKVTLAFYTGVHTAKHSATLSSGTPGVLHGVRTYLLQSPTGQIIETHSVSAGLDYPGVGPEHAWLKDSGRAEYTAATDEDALRGFRLCTQMEGIIPGKDCLRLRLPNKATDLYDLVWQPWSLLTLFGVGCRSPRHCRKIMMLSS